MNPVNTRSEDSSAGAGRHRSLPARLLATLGVLDWLIFLIPFLFVAGSLAFVAAWGAITGFVGYFHYRAIDRLGREQRPAAWLRFVLHAIAALHAGALAALFLIPTFTQESRYLYAELLGVDFEWFLAVFLLVWGFISIALVLRYRQRVPLRLRSRGSLLTVAAVAAIALCLLSPAVQRMVSEARGLLASFGADLPELTLFVFGTYQYWLLLPALGAISLAWLVAKPAAAGAIVNRGYDAVALLLVAGNVLFIAALGAIHLPTVKMCGWECGYADHGYTRLHAATQLGRSESVRTLLDRGADPNAAERDGKTPLQIAVLRRDNALVELLLARGADVSPRTGRGETPLHAAVRGGSIDIATLLIGKGAAVNAGDNDGQTPLHRAAVRHSRDDYWGLPRVHAELVALLLSNGADLHARDSDGDSALHVAAYYGLPDVAAVLLSAGARVGEVNRRGLTPLLRAVDSDPTVTQFHVYPSGMEVSSTSGEQRSVPGGIEIAQLLIARGADVKVASRAGVTALMAVVAGPGYSPERKRLVELMIERGANVNARDRNGRTALDAARKAGHAEVVELLVAHGATGTAE